MLVKTVIHVGIAEAEKTWIPAFAGMTESVLRWREGRKRR